MYLIQNDLRGFTYGTEEERKETKQTTNKEHRKEKIARNKDGDFKDERI